jgi:hypothetical protein
VANSPNGRVNLSEVTLTPAYGRDYKTAQEAEKDFLAGKDFVFHHFSGASAYCSVRDFISEGVPTAHIRYDKCTKTHTVHA